MNIGVFDCYDAVHDYIELQCLDDIIQTAFKDSFCCDLLFATMV